MFIRLNNRSALVSSAVFVCVAIFSASCFAQAPIVDASLDARAANREAVAQVADEQQGSSNQGELYNQLLLLQQEVMQLRGTLEEQAHQLRKMKEQGMERYIDLDRRLAAVATNPPAVATNASGVKAVALASSAPEQEGEKGAYDAAYAQVVSKQFDTALESFKQFLVDYPDGKYAANSYYWMGELYQVVSPQDLEASRQAFSQLLGQYPDHGKAADAMYKLGKVYFLKGNKEKSREWLNRVISSYSKSPYSSAADKARQFINSNF